MIKTLKKLFPYFLQSLDWRELLNGVAFILLGMAFTQHYGYRVYWRDFLHLALWFLFYKVGIFNLAVVLSDTVMHFPLDEKIGRLHPAEFRDLIGRFLWITTILFIGMSFVPLAQLIAGSGLNQLTLVIIALIYLSDLLFLLERSQTVLSGFQELIYGFVTAFLLPSLFFSLTRDYLKFSLLLLAFPLFLHLIAWKISANLEKERCRTAVSAGSILERIDALNGLSVTATLLLIGSLGIFLSRELLPLWTKLTILPVGLIAAWFVFRSIKKQDPNWQWALFFVPLLPIYSAIIMILVLWNH
jgi:hypothetical protein